MRKPGYISPFTFLLFLTLLSGTALAHPMPSSVLLLDVHERTVGAELQVPLSELGLALKEDLLGDPDAVLSTYGTQLETYLIEHIQPVTDKGEPWTVQVDNLTIQGAEQTATGPYQELVAHLTFTPPAGATTQTFTLHYDAVVHQVVTHTVLVSVRQDWANGLVSESESGEPVEVGVIRLNPADGSISPLQVDRSSGNLWTGFVSMFKLGMSHIREGTDHLLFLLTLLLPAPLLASRRRWRDFAGTRPALRNILKIVTAFTVGHSFTLILGALLRLELPAQPIEALIAVSILVSALHALRPLFPNRETLVAGGFGLVHGMAFSFTLAELSLSTSQMALSLLGFNLGIEAMQLIIIAVTMPWLILLARTPIYTPVRIVGASVAGVAALGWLGERVFLQGNIVTALVEKAAGGALWIGISLALLALAATLWQRSKPLASRGTG